ncbi:hypothetical protein [Streptomyces canus]|uniref:hypothetical protein n=1 Tax=Streptomyces canus TaxID=58343 RepID=UPI00381E93D2
MAADHQSEGMSASYRRHDADTREDFDRTLARFVRGHRDRWNITTFLEALDLLGQDVEEIRLTLIRKPDGRLAVTVGYELAPGTPVEWPAGGVVNRVGSSTCRK